MKSRSSQQLCNYSKKLTFISIIYILFILRSQPLARTLSSNSYVFKTSKLFKPFNTQRVYLFQQLRLLSWLLCRSSPFTISSLQMTPWWHLLCFRSESSCPLPQDLASAVPLRPFLTYVKKCLLGSDSE